MLAEKNKILCPSSKCTEGAILLGIVLPDGKVAISSTEYIVDEEFVSEAKKGRTPEDRFRFSTPCAVSKCGNWNGTRCSVIDLVDEEVKERIGKAPADFVPPACAIRPGCRWYLQNGSQACFACEFVVRGD